MFSITEKATQKRAKLHNKRLVLKVIYEQGPTSRADIARTTHLARTTVSTVVAALLAEGLVEEVGQKLQERGKPATMIRVVDDSRHIIGVDLGGRNFRGVVSDLRGNILHRQETYQANHQGDEALQQVYQLIDSLLARADKPVLGIGVGVPGLVDVEKGCVRQSGRLGWWELHLRQLLETRYNLPVHIVNDSHVAAFGEYTFGNGRDVDNLVVLTVGMGVSAGVVLNGQLHFGDSFGAGEIGHIRVVTGPQAKLCLCGNRGCLETMVSEGVLVEQARTIARHNSHSPLHQLVKNPNDLNDIDTVWQAFTAGDEDLQRLIAQMGQRLGYAVATIAGILNVERVVVSGSLARFGEPLLAAMRQELQASLHPMLADRTQIQISSLGADIVMKGAVAMVLSAETGLV